jgi:phage tail-like protein
VDDASRKGGTGSFGNNVLAFFGIARVPTRFALVIDDFSFGSFTACDGLGAELVVEQRDEGGNSQFVHQLPVRMKYPNVKLTRSVRGPQKRTIAKWMSDWAAKGGPHGTAVISALDEKGLEDPVISWVLRDVIPVKWTGPQWNGDTSKSLTESIEIAHHGFID